MSSSLADVRLLQIAYGDAEPVLQRVARVTDLVRQQRGADVVVLPELWAPGGFAYPAWQDAAEGLDGSTVRALSAAARAAGVLLHAGSISEAISRSIAGRSSSSSRPKECSTLIFAAPATGSQVLCTSCRYRTGTPAEFRRVDVRTNTSSDARDDSAGTQPVKRQAPSLGDSARGADSSTADQGERQPPSPGTGLSCGTRVRASAAKAKAKAVELLGPSTSTASRTVMARSLAPARPTRCGRQACRSSRSGTSLVSAALSDVVSWRTRAMLETCG